MDPVTKEKVTFLTDHSDADLLAALEKHMPRHLAAGALTPVSFPSAASFCMSMLGPMLNFCRLKTPITS
jgi:hypothetical protein